MTPVSSAGEEVFPALPRGSVIHLLSLASAAPWSSAGAMDERLPKLPLLSSCTASPGQSPRSSGTDDSRGGKTHRPTTHTQIQPIYSKPTSQASDHNYKTIQRRKRSNPWRILLPTAKESFPIQFRNCN